MKEFVPRAKNDVYREGNYVYIKWLNSEFCPVKILERYMHAASIVDINKFLPHIAVVLFIHNKFKHAD